MSKERLRKLIANDIACKEISYDKALEIMDKYDVFGNWDSWELENRPVDVAELEELIYEDIYGCF